MKKLFFAVLAIVMMAPMMMNAQDKMGYINSYEVMMLMPEVSQVETQLAEFNKTNQTYLETMYKEMQEKAAKYEEEKATLSESIKKLKEEELQSMYERFQTAQQGFQTEAQAKQAELLKPLQDKLQAAIDAVAKKQGLVFVFDTSAGGILYKGEKAVDITAQVKKELSIL